MTIPSGITRADVIAALRDLDAGVEHGFGDSIGYDLIWQRRRYPPKAAVGLAARRILGRPLRPDEFSGGEGSGQANTVLRELGFHVVPKLERNGADWEAGEIEAVVASYEEMLRAETEGLPYVKAERVRELERLLGRTRGSVEYKLENISAVLRDLGEPWIEGYKPASNYQDALRVAVEARLEAIKKIVTPIYAGPLDPVPPVAAATLSDVVVPAPSRRRSPARGRLAGLAHGVRGASREEANRVLGDAGEKWVLALERSTLAGAGRPDLASCVEWVAKTRGDGLGYDITSYRPDGRERHIEVKTTNLGITAAFFLSPCELETSRADPSFLLYRVFAFSSDPHLYVLTPPLDEKLDLAVAQWLAAPRSNPATS